MRAGLVQDASEWRWSSARVHLGLDVPGPLNLERWQQRSNTGHWRHCLSSGLIEATWAERLREATRSGFPMGDDQFRENLEQQLGRKTKPGQPGRPRKSLEVPCCHIRRSSADLVK